MPDVSVIIPAYNQADFLGDAIRSVLDQTFSDFELVVVDDGSTDHTSQIALGFSDPRLYYIFQENRGLSAARNTGIRNTKGQYLTFLDSDDLFFPAKLELLRNALACHPEWGMVAGQAIPIDEFGVQVGKIFDNPPPENLDQLLLSNPFHVGSVMLRRSWQEKVGNFDEILRSYEDWDMWLRLVQAGCQIGWVPEPVSLYRFHSAQMTRIGTQMTAATFAVLDKVFRDPGLPMSWLDLKDEAYSRANLRAAAQAYHACEFDNAKKYLTNAVKLDSTWLEDRAKRVAKQFVAWTDLPKVTHPLKLLDRIYSNLPECLAVLRKRKRDELGQVAIQLAFSTYQRGETRATRAFALRAFYHQPAWLLNRGAVTIFLRSLLGLSSKNITQPEKIN